MQKKLFAYVGNLIDDIDLSAPLSESQGIRIFGAAANDLTGSALYTADVNGDSFADLIIGAPSASVSVKKQSRSSAGMVYILWGGRLERVGYDEARIGVGVDSARMQSLLLVRNTRHEQVSCWLVSQVASRRTWISRLPSHLAKACASSVIKKAVWLEDPSLRWT